MFKTISKYLILVLALFFFISNSYAYEYINSKNKSSVQNSITEIYDARQQYLDLVGDYEETEIKVISSTSTSYWWPIGSADVVESGGKKYAKGDPEAVIITSNFGYREDPLGRGTSFHSGVDISGGSGEGNVNVIAAKDGVVVYPTSDVSNNCPSSSSLSDCGGGYGNYIIIQHSDGNFTLYAHLYENSTTVTAGESVQQGQVIGKMGSSGNSTGAHLHFEIREGQNAGSATVDPLTYISAENPRSVVTGSRIIEFLNSWEGHTDIVGDTYLVEDIGDNVRSVGAGVTLEYNVSRFESRGINVEDYPIGTYLPITLVDEIKMEITNEKRNYVEGVIAGNSITLTNEQIDALTSMVYNCGNIDGFVNAYKEYGNTDEFYNNWFFRCIMRGTQFEEGLTRRRNAEWTLFHTGEYVFNS